MIRLNIHEAKTQLSRYLKKLKFGDVIVLCRRNVPIAEIRSLPKPPDGRRDVGLDSELIEVPSAFFEPLSEEVLDSFDGLST